MDYRETENWIRTNIIKNGSFSLSIFSKGEKIFECPFSDPQEYSEPVSLKIFLHKMGRTFRKIKNMAPVYWFKVNLIDNAITDLVGLGKISELEDLDLIESLLKYDKADQNGDVIVGVFDQTKKWVIKLTNNQDKHRVYIRLYGQGKIIEVLKSQTST